MDNPSSGHAPHETITALHRLAALLALPDVPSYAADLTLDHLGAWKAQIEALAFEQPAAAQDAADLLVRIGAATGDPQRAALTLWTAANVHFILDRPGPALALFEQAEVIYRQHGERLQVARMGVGVISALCKLGRYAEALAWGSEIAPTLAASAEPTDQRRLAGTYNGMGISSEHLGRYIEALDGYEHKLAWWQRQTGPRADIETARSLVNIGVVKTRLGLYVEALDAFSEARQKLTQAEVSGQVQDDIARIDMDVARLEALRSSPPAVVAEAFALARQSRATADPHGTSTDLALLDLFELEWRVHVFGAQAVAAVDVAVLADRCRRAGLAYETARAELLQGRLLAAAGDEAGAAALFGRVDKEARARGAAEMVIWAGLEQARLLRRIGAGDPVRHQYERVIAQVEGVRDHLPSDELRAGYLEDKLSVYQELAAMLLETGNDPAAFQVIERAKARTLTELLAARAEGSDGRSTATAAATQLQAEIAERRQRLERAATPVEPTQRHQIEREIVGLTRQIARQTRRAGLASADPPAPEAIADLLPAGVLALSYAVIQDQVWAFLIGPAGLCDRPVRLGPALTPDALKLDLARITMIGRLPRPAAERWLAAQVRAAQAPLAQWYTRYLMPLRTHLARYDRLLIVPDGLLNLLPFSAFYNPETQRYLIETHDIIQAPSLATWTTIAKQAATRRRLSTPRSVLAVGYSADGHLPHAVAEAEQVAAQYAHAQLLADASATRARLRTLAPEQDLIYLATHGLFRADMPAFSYLELADGRLEAFEISELDLTADLVVLSACETAAGRLTGNELMGLVRAFLHAGARSVLATHWPVDDQAMRALMAVFIQRLEAGARTAHALGAAQRVLCEGKSDLGALAAHPFFWGGAVLVGADGNGER